MILKEPTPAIIDAPTRDAVLIVDDEKPLLDIYASALSPLFEVVMASNVREAELSLAARDFKAIIADHLMPGGNGMELLVGVREKYPLVQRVLITGYMKPEMLLRGVRDAGLFRYLLKPVAVVDLVKAVKEAVSAATPTRRP